MQNSSTYLTINTKIRALKSSMLTNKDFRELLSRENTSDAFVYINQNTIYSKYLKTFNNVDMSRHIAEYVIKNRIIDDMTKISYYLADNNKSFYRALIKKYEIENIKLILRTIKAKDDLAEIENKIIDLNSYSEINYDSLLSCKSIPEVIKKLKDTKYYNSLDKFVNDKDDINMFALEMTLDLLYFNELYKEIEFLSKKDNDILKNIYGTYIDLLNIQWMYRGKRFYNLSPDELYNYTIPYGNIIDAKKLKKICYIESLSEYQSVITSLGYDFIFDHERTKDIYMERRILRFMYYKIKSVQKNYSQNISQIICHTFLLNYEMKDFITAIECIRYKIPAEQSKYFLIRNI